MIIIDNRIFQTKDLLSNFFRPLQDMDDFEGEHS